MAYDMAKSDSSLSSIGLSSSASNEHGTKAFVLNISYPLNSSSYINGIGVFLYVHDVVIYDDGSNQAHYIIQWVATTKSILTTPLFALNTTSHSISRFLLDRKL